MASIMGWANIIGLCALVIGFVGGPIISSGSNLSPLLGLFITGPLGYFLGGVIGFWLLLRMPTRKITLVEWGALVIIWLLIMAYYLVFAIPFGPHVIEAVIGIQLVTVLGTCFLWAQRFSSKSFNNFILIALSTLFIVGTEIFPPVTRPDWGEPRNGFYGKVPAATLYNDSRLDSRKDVPQLTVNRTGLLLIWLTVISVNGITWMVTWMITNRKNEGGGLCL